MRSLALTASDRRKLFADGAIRFQPAQMSVDALRQREYRARNPERARQLNIKHVRAWRERQKLK